MGQRFDINGTDVEFTNCITCGVLYCLPCAMMDEQRKTGGSHYCPNGHSQGWFKGNTEFDRVKRERDNLKQQMARVEDERREAVAAAEARAEKAEAATKRIKKRASAGNCPCCKRTFSNMAEHMKRQHPEFIQEGGAKVVPIKVTK